MKPIIKEIGEITDSKELYETKPHPFLSIFIYILLGCIVFAGVWMYFGEIDIVSKGFGVVRPNENISRIRNKVQGEVVLSNLEEGKFVKAGDILFEIGYENLEVKRLQAISLVEDVERQLYLVNKLKDSIEQGSNLFSPIAEKEYYERYVKYEQDYQNLLGTISIETRAEEMTTTQTNLNKTIYEEKIRQYEQTYKELEQYKDSILLQHNLFENKESMYAIAFDNYVIQVYELKKTVEDKKMAYELGKLLDQDGFIAKKEVEDAKIALELAENDLKKLELSTLNAVEKQIEEVTKAKQAAQQEQSKLIVDYELLEISNEHRQLALRKYKTDLLVSLYDQIEQLNMSYQSRARELEGIELSIKDCTIIAPISGTLHITQEVSRGDLMSAGADVATIIPLNDSIYKVEIFMPNSEIAGIQTGDFIKYRFDALPYKEYGQLAGEVHKISVDARVSEAQGISGYIIEGSIPNETVYSYKDEPAQIKVGMTCEAHIVTEQKKILFYLLEKINLMD